MKYQNYVVSIALLLAASFLYNKFKINVERDDKVHELNIIKKYLLKEDDALTIDQLSSIKKPILWIHINYEKNSRVWESFGSRNSKELNQDYLYLTLRSIINKCGDYFHIVLFDDDSFCKLLDWGVDFNKVGGIQKHYLRTLGLVKVLHKYGGMFIEPSFILFKSLEGLYNKVIQSQKMSVAEFLNKSSDSHIMHLMPSTSLMACVKNCPVMDEFRNYLEILISKDYTNESSIEGSMSKWLFNKTQNNEINYIDGKFIGTKDEKNKPIELDRLLGSTYLELHDKAYGLYIPQNDLLKRTNYNWFVKLNSEQVLSSNTIIGKYLLLSNM
jgi:hypothetical protein